MHIRRDTSRLHFVDPKRFEKFVADVFRANYTNAEVVHVGKPNDGGVDVLLIDAQEEQLIVQVKRAESNANLKRFARFETCLGR